MNCPPIVWFGGGWDLRLVKVTQSQYLYRDNDYRRVDLVLVGPWSLRLNISGGDLQTLYISVILVQVDL